MQLPLQTGSTVRDRYRVRQTFLQDTHKHICLAEDQKCGNEACLLTEFISDAPGKVLDSLPKPGDPKIPAIKGTFLNGNNGFIVQSCEEVRESPPWNECEVVQLLNRILPTLSFLQQKGVSRTDCSGDLQSLAKMALGVLPKQISDQRRVVLERMMAPQDSSNHFSSFESALQALNTTSLLSTEKLPPPPLAWWLLGGLGVGILLILTGIAGIFAPKTPQPIASSPAPNPDSEIQCPIGADILVLACGVPVNDVDSTDFDQGILTAQFKPNGKSEDRLTIYTQGSNVEGIGVDKNTITYKGTEIASFTEGTGTTPLKVTFNTNANQEAVRALVNYIVYRNTLEKPSLGNRTVQLWLTDGDGGTSQIATRTISVTTLNKAPIPTVPGDQTVKEDKELVVKGIGIQDSDAGSENIGVILKVDRGVLIINENVPDGVPSIEDNRSSSVTLVGTVNQINSTLKSNRAVVYEGEANYSGNITLTVTASDSGKKVTDVQDALVFPPGAVDPKTGSRNILIVVDPDNDPPDLGLASSQSTSETQPSEFNQQVIVLMQSWLNAKSEVFGSSYNLQTLERYTTGNYLEQSKARINELRQAGETLSFGQSSVELVKPPSVQGNQAIVEVRITENITRKQSNGRQSYDGPTTGVFRFVIRQENSNTLKIAERL